MSNGQDSVLLQLLLQSGAFLAIAGVGVSRLREGAWAALAALGASLAATVPLVTLAMLVEARYSLDSARMWDFFVRHSEWLSPVMAWTQAAGIVLIATAFVLRARTSRQVARTP